MFLELQEPINIQPTNPINHFLSLQNFPANKIFVWYILNLLKWGNNNLILRKSHNYKVVVRLPCLPYKCWRYRTLKTIPPETTKQAMWPPWLRRLICVSFHGHSLCTTCSKIYHLYSASFEWILWIRISYGSPPDPMTTHVKVSPKGPPPTDAVIVSTDIVPPPWRSRKSP